MATLDPDLWKSALQKLAFLTGSALMELFNVKGPPKTQWRSCWCGA